MFVHGFNGDVECEGKCKKLGFKRIEQIKRKTVFETYSIGVCNAIKLCKLTMFSYQCDIRVRVTSMYDHRVCLCFIYNTRHKLYRYEIQVMLKFEKYH